MKVSLPVGTSDVFCMQGVKDIPCIWRVKPELAELYGLPSDLPDRLVGPRNITYREDPLSWHCFPGINKQLLLFC